MLVPDAPELIADLIVKETDMATRRNAFIMLQNCAPEKAISYLATVANMIPTFDENMQLAVIETVRKEARHARDRPRYMKLLFALLQAGYASVQYEAAASLMSLTQNTVAAQACAASYVDLLNKESDHNVKWIVLEKLAEIVEKHEKLGDDLVLDLLRCLATPDMDVRRKTCAVALEMANPRNIEGMVQILKKELVRTDVDRALEYRQLLIQTMHTCAMQYPTVVSSVVFTLMDYIKDTSYASAVDVIEFVREVMETCPDLRTALLDRLLLSIMELKSGKVMRGVLWILGEYVSDDPLASRTLQIIQLALGEFLVPAVTNTAATASTNSNNSNSNSNTETTSVETSSDPTSPIADSPTLSQQQQQQQQQGQSARTGQRKVLLDGTYAVQTSLSSPQSATADFKRKPPLQALLHNGDFFTGTVLATALTKLCFKLQGELKHRVAAESMRILTQLLQLGARHGMDEDACHRIHQCLTALPSESQVPLVKELMVTRCRESFQHWLQQKEHGPSAVVEQGHWDPATMTMMMKIEKKKKKKKKGPVQVTALESPITFHLLKPNAAEMIEDEYLVDVTRATGMLDTKAVMENKLDRLVQLTGFSDPIYAEAYVHVHQYDILLDVLLVNQTTAVLQNVTLEFATLGDLKLVERPQPFTLAPKSFHTLKANIKVSSTETGIIFGSLVYDAHASYCVLLQDIYVDIMDYIHPAQCSATQFRAMWVEFEWENKVNVVTTLTDLHAYVRHLLRSTNLACLSPIDKETGSILAANFYAKSVFGEDVLANLCIEKTKLGGIQGHIRIRSKTQGIALSLGDKITQCQKKKLEERVER